jgi:hypothetical protein
VRTLENAVDNSVLVVAIGIFLVQVSILFIILLSVRRLALNLERLHMNLDQKVTPTLADFREVLGETKGVLHHVRSAAENFTSITESVKYQVKCVNAVIEDTTDRARAQIARADDVVTDAIEKMEATSAIVQQNVLAPLREVSAIIRGLQSGLQFFFARRKNSVDQVHQDEELFI